VNGLDLGRHAERDELAPDENIIDSRLVDSMSFIELIYVIESASGAEIDFDTIDLADFPVPGRHRQGVLLASGRDDGAAAGVPDRGVDGRGQGRRVGTARRPVRRSGLARDLASDNGFELLDKYPNGGLRQFIWIRTKFLDDSVTGLRPEDASNRCAARRRPGHQGVPPRLAAGVVVYEVDHGPLIEEKQRRLDRLGARTEGGRVRAVAADLTTQWLPDLSARDSIRHGRPCGSSRA